MVPQAQQILYQRRYKWTNGLNNSTMLLIEFFEKIAPGRYDADQDNSVLKIDDTRKTRLTLAQINRLRIMNDVRKLEHEQQLDRVKKQYKQPVEGGEMGMGGGASL